MNIIANINAFSSNKNINSDINSQYFATNKAAALTQESVCLQKFLVIK